MANPIGQVVAAFTALIVVLIAFSIFDPMISGTFNEIVSSYFANAAGTPLETDLAALELTRDMVMLFFKLFVWFIIFAIFVRLFVYLGFYTEEQGYG